MFTFALELRTALVSIDTKNKVSYSIIIKIQILFHVDYNDIFYRVYCSGHGSLLNI